MSTIQRFLVSVFAAALVALGAPVATAATSTAAAAGNEIKAAYIFNFLKFVEWPADALPTATLDVDVIEDDALATALRRTVDGKRVQNRAVVVRSDRHECDSTSALCVVGMVSEAAIALQLERVRSRPVLTIGDSPRFTQLGGIIQFRASDGQLRFQINQPAAAARGLRISGRLVVLSEGQHQ